jgi:2-polyprenyl-3-methyl-5-hydroxy-6-metoxy-1,4-benzoquinol methylase
VQSENQKRFAAAAATWDENPGRGKLALAVAGTIRRAVKLDPEMDAMDYGCGTGLVTLALQPFLRTVLAVDVSPEMLQLLDRKLEGEEIENVSTLRLDLATDEPPDARFHLIFSSMTLHHVADPAALISRLGGLLHPGGALCLADLDAEDGSFHPDKTGVAHSGFSAEQVQGMFTAAGLREVRSAVACVIPRPQPEGGVREYPVVLTVGVK